MGEGEAAEVVEGHQQRHQRCKYQQDPQGKVIFEKAHLHSYQNFLKIQATVISSAVFNTLQLMDFLSQFMSFPQTGFDYNVHRFINIFGLIYSLWLILAVFGVKVKFLSSFEM